MFSAQRLRIEKALKEMINDVYNSHLRKMQSDMHSCAAKCCEDVNLKPDMDHVQNCIEDCSVPLTRVQDFMQHELGQFHNGFQDCVMGKYNEGSHNRPYCKCLCRTIAYLTSKKIGLNNIDGR